MLVNFELALGLLAKFGELRKFVWFSGNSKEGVKRGPIQTYFSFFHFFHFSKPSGWFQHQSKLANMGNFSSIIWMWEISSIHKLWKVISSSYNCELKGSWCHWISFNEGYAHASGWLLGNNSQRNFNVNFFFWELIELEFSKVHIFCMWNQIGVLFVTLES